MAQVLCRMDHEGKPVVFIADSLKNGQIKAWRDGEQEIKRVGIDYYQATSPLSEKDAAHLAKKFGKVFNEETVFVRQRLPRTYRSIPDVLTGNGNGKTTAGKRNTKANRRAAAKKRYQAEIAQTNGEQAKPGQTPEGSPAPVASGAAPSVVMVESGTGGTVQAQEGTAIAQAAKASGMDTNDPKFAQLVINIAKILKDSL